MMFIYIYICRKLQNDEHHYHCEISAVFPWSRCFQGFRSVPNLSGDLIRKPHQWMVPKGSYRAGTQDPMIIIAFYRAS